MAITTRTGQIARESGTFRIGGDRTVVRLGFGAMRITGPGIWGPPRDHDEAIRTLRRAVALGVTFIDTADSYGPDISEELIHEALYPYPPDLVIATKAGLVRTGPDQWYPVGRPEYLRQQCEMSMRRLQVEPIELFQLHRVDAQVPFDEQIGVLADLRKEGKIRHVGLSNVTVDQILAAQLIVPIATVQNRYNLIDREFEQVVNFCSDEDLGFIPWSPAAAHDLPQSHGTLAKAAEQCGVTPAQIAVAWLLRRSPVILPIPGTTSVAHLEENVAAAGVHLTDAQFQALTSRP